MVANLALPLLLALWSPTAAPACACSCAPAPLSSSYALAGAVFTGRVASVSWDDDHMVATVRLSVDVAWKWPGGAQAPPRDIVLRTAQAPACGVHFREGEEWLVFAHPEAPLSILWASQCSGSQQFDRDTDEWRRQSRERAEAGVRWLRQAVGEGTRPP